MKKSLTFLLVILLMNLCIQLPSQAEAAEQQGYKSQTILIYMIGSDLESEGGMATSDIREMLKARPDKERLNVLAMTGGTKQWKNTAIPSDKLSVFKIEALNPKPVHQWERGSMGSPEALTRFLDYALNEYPAESYGLILWDHGGGPMAGFGMDTAFEGDGLTLLELRDALEASQIGGERKLEWLAFDACLMASLEVAALLSPYSNYLVASQETLPGQGFDYAFLSALAKSGLRGPEVAQAIIDSTFVYYEKLSAKNPEYLFPVTLSLTDLAQVVSVLEKLNQLFTNLDQGLQAGIYSTIARNRDMTKDYGRTTTSNAYDLIDLEDLAMNMEALYPERAKDLREAMDEMVVYNRSNVPRTNGLSLYFPLRNKEMYKSAWGDLYQAFDLAPAYQKFMQRFGNILLADSMSDWTGDSTPQVSYQEDTGEYMIQLSPQQVENYDRSEYYILARLRGEEYMLIYMSGDVTLDKNKRLKPNFNGMTMFIEDEEGKNSTIPYMMETENVDGIAQYQIPIMVAGPDSEGEEASAGAKLLAQIDKEKGQARITGAIKDEVEGSLMGKRDIDLAAWDSVYLIYSSFYLSRDSHGAMLPLGDWSSPAMPKVLNYRAKGGLKVRYAPIEEDMYEYFVLISIIDTQGYVYSSELMPLNGTAPAEPPVTQKTPVHTVDYAPGDNPQDLGKYEGIAVRLAEVKQTDAGEEQASLNVKLMLENTTSQESGVGLSWAMVNGVMAQAHNWVHVPAFGQAELNLNLPVDSSTGGIGLSQAGVTSAREISFKLELTMDSSIPFSWDYLSMASVPSDTYRMVAEMGYWRYTDVLRVLTDVPLVPTPDLPRDSIEPLSPLWEGEGISIELAGTMLSDGEDLIIPLKITNRSQLYDLVQLDQSSINGIMAPLSMWEDVQPGGILYTQARIALKRTVMPPGFEEYQFMFDGYDNLEALGIDQVGEVLMRFALDAHSKLGHEGRDAIRHTTDPIVITIEGMEDYVQPLDEQGEEIYAWEGIRIVRKNSDPDGKSFYIENKRKTSIGIETFGRVKADEEDYAANSPLRAKLLPESSAYVRLFDSLPGIEPDALTLSFYISVIDLDENELLTTSDKITLLFLAGE